MRSLWIAFTIVLGGWAVAALADDTFTLKRSSKEGETRKYKLVWIGEMEGGIQFEYTSTFTEKVIKVEPSGQTTIEITAGEAKVKFGDQEMELPAQPTTTLVSKANGEIVEIKSSGTEDKDEYRREHMTLFLFPDDPVKVGDKWSREIKADPKRNIVAAKVEYEVIAAEKVGDLETLKIKFNFKESEGAQPISSEGHFWIHVKDGSMVKLVGASKNVPTPGLPTPISARYTIERQ